MDCNSTARLSAANDADAHSNRSGPFSFPSTIRSGACPECKGFGNVLRYDPDLVIPDHSKSLAQGAIEPWSKPGTDWWQKQMLLAMKRHGVDITRPFQVAGTEDVNNCCYGKAISHSTGSMISSTTWKASATNCMCAFCSAATGRRSIAPAVMGAVSNRMPASSKSPGSTSMTSPHDNRTAHGVAASPGPTPFERGIATDILRQLTAKLGFLLRVGLGYLTLARQTKTLSGGEAQRVSLANQLGAHLVGTLYVLDEPTIGLHARDTDLLAGILKDLAAAGNTVVVVEHDRQMIESADHIVELGPQSGEKGGEVVCAAPAGEFLRDRRAITARYLRGEEHIPLPASRRSGTGKVLVIAGASEHNLKDLVVRFPLGMLICITGVSGSGKSTLVEDTLYRALARAFRIEFSADGALQSDQGDRASERCAIDRPTTDRPDTSIQSGHLSESLR